VGGRCFLHKEEEGRAEGGKEDNGPVGEEEEGDLAVPVEALREGGREGGREEGREGGKR
jgi:hypothetical protein